MPWYLDDQTPRFAIEIGGTPVTEIALPFATTRNPEDLVVLVDAAPVAFTLTGTAAASADLYAEPVVQLATAVSNATVVVYRRNLLEQRFAPEATGLWMPRALAAELARIWMTLQDHRMTFARCVREPFEAEPIDVLPAAADRINKLLGFDPAGAFGLIDPAEVGGVALDTLVPRAGGVTVTGQITMAVAPTESGHLATKAYVDAAGVGGGGGGISAVVQQLVSVGASVTLGAAHEVLAASGTELHARTVLVTTAGAQVDLTLPATATPGTAYSIVVAPNAAQTVRLVPASGATLDGVTDPVALDGPRSAVAVLCIANAGGSAAQFMAAGALASGQTLTGQTVLQETTGAYPCRLADITDNITLGPSAVGCVAKVSMPSAGKTITITATRGSIGLLNRGAHSCSVLLPGGASKTLTAGKDMTVAIDGADLATAYELTPL